MKRWAAVLVLIVVVLAGCGGGTKKTTAASTPSSDSSSKFSSVASAIGASASDCEEASRAMASAGGASNGLTRDDSFRARDSFRALKNVVSDQELKDALETLADAYDAFGNAIGDYDPSKGGVPPAGALAALQAFANEDFLNATQKLSAYFAGGCKG